MVFVVLTISSPLSTLIEDKQGSAALKATDETAIDDHKILQPDFSAPRVETFTDFIQRVGNILNTYKDTALITDFFDILHEEIRKYHYKGCKFYELTENDEFRSLMAEKFDLKTDINEVVTLIIHGTYGKKLLNYINSLYREDAREKFRKLLSDLNAYGNSTSERPKNHLVNIIRDGVRAIVFDHYTNLNIKTRHALNKKIITFLKEIKEALLSSSKTNLFPYKSELRQSGNTVKIYGYNNAIEDENLEQDNSKIHPTSTITAINNNIHKLKANDETHREEATKHKTSKEENNSQQLQMTYLSTEESSAETIEGNRIELSPERHQEFNSQSYATLYTKEISSKATKKPEIIYKSDLKSKLVQKMLAEVSTGRLPAVQPTTTPGLRHGILWNEETRAESVTLKKAILLRMNSSVTDEDVRRSIAPHMPEEELSTVVWYDREGKTQKSLANSNIITTVRHGIKDYIRTMRNLQNKVNQVWKFDENNQITRINVISNGYREVNVLNEHEAKNTTNKVRVPKRNVKKTNSVNKDKKIIESNKEIVQNKKATGSETIKATKTVKSVNVTVNRSLEPLPTVNNNAGSTTINDNNKSLTKTIFTITKKVGNVTLNITKEVNQKRIYNNATYDYATKDDSTRRYRRVLQFSSPPLYDQPFDEHIFREGLHPEIMTKMKKENGVGSVIDTAAARAGSVTVLRMD